METKPDSAASALSAGLELLAALAKRHHTYCEDGWYSCPKAEDGCFNDSRGPECDCGADEHNAVVDALVAKLRSNVQIEGQAASGLSRSNAGLGNEILDVRKFVEEIAVKTNTEFRGAVGMWGLKNATEMFIGQHILKMSGIDLPEKLTPENWVPNVKVSGSPTDERTTEI